jgi:hypothetical protein
MSAPSLVTSAYSDNAGGLRPSASVNVSTIASGEHRELATGHVDRRESPPGQRVERRAARNAERRRSDVNADFVVAIGHLAHRKCVVDFRSRRIVDREGADFGDRQLGERRRPVVCAERSALRERLREKRVVVVVVRGRNGAARGQQRHRIHLPRVARGCERFPLERVLVRLVEKHRKLLTHRFRQPARAEFLAPSAHPLGLVLLALDGRERGRKRGGRRLPVATLAPLVEVHRRRSQRHGHGSGLDRSRRVPVVLARQVGKAEVVVTRHLPQEVRVELARLRLRLRDEKRRRRLGIAQQHRRRLDLEALAGCSLDLKRRIVVRQDCPGLELAVVLEKDVHGRVREEATNPARRPRPAAALRSARPCRSQSRAAPEGLR